MRNIYRAQNQAILSTVGSEFEDDIIAVLKQKYPKNFTAQTGTRLDKEQGTDAIFKMGSDEIRMDVTTNFKNKDMMPFIHETDIPATRIPPSFFKVGVRVGNSYAGGKEFETPVMVVGIDLDEISGASSLGHSYGIHDEELIDNMEKHAGDIMTAVMTVYEDYGTPSPEDREDYGVESVIKPNSKFTTPIKIRDERYKMACERLGIPEDATSYSHAFDTPDFQ